MLGMKVWRRMRTGAGWLAGVMLLTHCGGAEEAVKDGPPRTGDTAEKTAELDSCEAVVQVEDLEVVATDDTYVTPAIPGATYGGLDRVVVDGDPQSEVYLKFNLTHGHLQGGTLVRARLQLYAVDGTTDGPALYRTGTEWSEETLSWNTRPGWGSLPKLGDLGAINTNTRVEYDLTPVVTEPGTYAFALAPTSGNGADFASSESGRAHLMPQLALTVAKSVCTRRGTGGDVAWTWMRGGESHQAADGRLAMAADGSFVTVARFNERGNFGAQDFTAPHDFVLAKYGPDGSHQWSRAYIPQVYDEDVYVKDITLTPRGNILLVGNYLGAPDFGGGPLPPTVGEDMSGVFIAKYSPNGTFVWARGFVPTAVSGAEVTAGGHVVTTDANGSLIVAGTFVGELNLGGETFTSGPTDSQEGMFLAKYSWEGDHLWSLAVPAGTHNPWSDSTVPGDVLANADGRIFVGGSAGTGRLGATASLTPFVAAYGPEGTLLWSRALNGAAGGVGALALMPGGAVAFGGSFSGSFTFAGATLTSPSDGGGQRPSDGLLGVLSASGSDTWARRYGTERDEGFSRIDTDASGNISVVAQAIGPFDLGGGPLGHPTAYGHYVARFTSTGTHLWSRLLDPDLHALGLEVSVDGGTVLVGDFARPVTVNGQEYLPPGDSSEVLFLRFAP
jgi:hypothetical protein